MIKFDSYLQKHKSLFGAIPQNSAIQFCVEINESLKIDYVNLIARFENEHSFLLKKTENRDGYDLFKGEISLKDIGLYRYRFEAVKQNGDIMFIGTNNGHEAVFGDWLPEWYLTVYDQNFYTGHGYDGAVMYQIFPDRFFKADGVDTSGAVNERIIHNNWNERPHCYYDYKGFKCNDFFMGNLKGIEQKLGYLKELGVTHLYLNPIFESAENHRYCTSNYLKIDPYLGTTDDFISLCKSAKNNNIKIILDGVFSHTGDDSIYFNRYKHYGESGAYNDPDSPYRCWYNFKGCTDDYDCWWGFKTLPNVNETNEQYLEFITGKDGVLNYWQSLGASGFRLDVADELPDLFLEKLRTAVKSYDNDAIIIGEVWENAVTKESYGARRKFLLGRQCDSVMNYPFANAIIDFCINGNAEQFYKTVMEILDMYPKPAIDCLMNMLSTHDTARAINRLGAEYIPPREKQADAKLTSEQKELGKHRFMMAAALQYMLPGIPCVYYGDEAGNEGFGDPSCRGTYPWDNQDVQLLTLHKQLGIIRQNYKNDFSLPLEFECAKGGIVCFRRGKLRIIANCTDHSIKANGKRVFGYNADEFVHSGGVIIEEV